MVFSKVMKKLLFINVFSYLYNSIVCTINPKALKMRYLKPHLKTYLLVCMLLSAVFSYAQTPGDPANFSIRGDFYSGTFSTLTDDWFKGLTANGMINESNTVANLAITNSKSNTPFIERQSYQQFVVVGYFVCHAIYPRDYINMLSSSNNEKSTFDVSNKNWDNLLTCKSTPSNVGSSVDLVAGFYFNGSTISKAELSIWDLKNYKLLVEGDEAIIITATVGPNCGPLSNVAEIISSDRQDPDSIPVNGN